MGGWSVVLPDADLAVPIATFESLAEVKALPEMPPQGAVLRRPAAGQPVAPVAPLLNMGVEALRRAAEDAPAAQARAPVEAPPQAQQREPQGQGEPVAVEVAAVLPLEPPQPQPQTFLEFVKQWAWDARGLLLSFALQAAAHLLILMAVLLALIWVTSTPVGKSLQATVRSSADTVADALSATGAAVTAVANVTRAVSDLTVAAAASSRSIAADVMTGVDLSQVAIRQEQQSVTFIDVAAFHKWQQEEDPWQLPHSLLSELLSGIDAVANKTLLDWRWSRHFLNMTDGRRVRFTAHVSWHRSSITVKFDMVTASFRAFWTNPLWDALSYDTSAESEQVVASLDRIIDLQRLQ